MIMKKVLLMCLTIVVAHQYRAQQDAQYTLYMINGQALNPAYISSFDGAQANIQYRNQWASWNGAPRNVVVNGSMDYLNHRMASGINFSTDKIGVFTKSSVAIDQSYRIQTPLFNWSFGLRASLDQVSGQFSQLNLSPDGRIDQSLGGDWSKTTFNMGAGTYLNSNNWWVGVVIPRFVRNQLSSSGAQEVIHRYVSAGYVFGQNRTFQVKPSVLYKSTKGINPSIDYNLSLYYKEKIGLGIGKRSNDSFKLLAEWIIKDSIQLAYGYDVTTSALKTYAASSHEILIRYSMNQKSVQHHSPRLF